MPRKAQREWNQVSDLVGRIMFTVRAGKDASDPKFVPKTDGLIVEVTFDSQSDKMYNALCNVVVAAQATIKRYYVEHGRLPFEPGKVQKVKSDGTFDLPNVVHVDRIEAQAKAGTLSTEDMVRLATAMGLAVPVEWTASQYSQNGQGDTDDTDDAYRYNEDQLGKLTILKLKVLAQDEHIDGYDDLTRQEIIDQLALVRKAH